MASLSAGFILAVLIVAVLIIIAVFLIPGMPQATPDDGSKIPHSGRIALPPPKVSGTISVEEALLARRSVREYAAEPLDIAQVSQLLWAAQGITSPSGFRTAPSAGALYPLEVFVACGNVTGLLPGVYRYIPDSHALERIIDRDIRDDLYRAALRQESVRNAPAVIAITADYNRTMRKYGERGIRYVHMEAGHASENICLQAYSLGLGTVTIGAFDDGAVKDLLGMPQGFAPLYLMPVGRVTGRSS
jgi:SagB-type dehydrogenase family enzyme